MPEIKAPEGILFKLKDIAYSPTSPRMKEPFTVKGKADLFNLPFLLPVWVIVTVEYPESLWEKIIPIIGAKQVREMSVALGGNFEVTFTTGFKGEGEFKLTVRLYTGPSMPLDSFVLPPFPPVATYEETFSVVGEIPEEETAFSIAQPSVAPGGTIQPGATITISCPVTSQATKAQTIKVKCQVYEGSILPGHGSKLNEYLSVDTPISPGETKTFTFSHTAVAGTTDRRDIGVGVYIKGNLVAEHEFDDVFYVGQPPAEVIDFNLGQPTASPSQVSPGATVTITCPVTSACTKQQTATAVIKIYEGSVLPGRGTLLETKTSSPFAIAPGQTYNVTVQHTALVGTIDRRDVGVEVSVGGHLVKTNDFDDVFYVTPEAKLERLEVTINPVGAGTVTVEPTPASGAENAWYFPAGTQVYVTAHPNSGYVFKSWSGEMTDTTAIRAPVYPMTETRGITAHFEKVEAYTLSVSVNPYGGGTVTKSPDKAAYAKGEYVTLYASPSSGYDFDYWSGGASGYSTSVSVYMDGNKSVVANFKKQLPPPTQLVSFAVHSKGPPFPTGYWILIHYTMDGVLDFQSQVTPIETNIRVTGVQSAGYLSVFTENSISGEWREQVYSNEFAAVDGEEYTYDINTGIVYVGII